MYYISIVPVSHADFSKELFSLILKRVINVINVMDQYTREAALFRENLKSIENSDLIFDSSTDR